MVVFCIETEKAEIINKYVFETNQRLNSNSLYTLFFKNSSFAYCLKDINKYILIINIETNFIFNLPKLFFYFIMKRAIKKQGYKGKINLINNNIIFIKIMKQYRKWDKKK